MGFTPVSMFSVPWSRKEDGKENMVHLFCASLSVISVSLLPLVKRGRWQKEMNMAHLSSTSVSVSSVFFTLGKRKLAKKI